MKNAPVCVENNVRNALFRFEKMCKIERYFVWKKYEKDACLVRDKKGRLFGMGKNIKKVQFLELN